MSAELQTVLAATAVFTLTVVTLVLAVTALRHLLTPGGTVTVVVNEQQRLSAPRGERLAAFLADRGIHLPAACGGKGSCGQCRVVIRQGAPPLTAVEAAHVSAGREREGERLACMVVLSDDLAIHLPDNLLQARQWVCTVEGSRFVTTLMKEIVLRLPPGETLDFHAGSYVLVEAPAHSVRFSDFDLSKELRAEWGRHDLLRLQSRCPEPTVRAYSLANPPAENDRAVLTVRIALPPHDEPEDTPPGRVSSWLFSLESGAEVKVSGPFGEFRALESGREMVLIGGGAGVAPLRSIILDQLRQRSGGRRIGFWYGARNLRELCYRREFDQLAARHERFDWQPALSEPGPQDAWNGPTGFIHKVVYERYLCDHPAPEEIEYYICGPPLMNLAVLQMLEDLGVGREMIFLDDFGVST